MKYKYFNEVRALRVSQQKCIVAYICFKFIWLLGFGSSNTQLIIRDTIFWRSDAYENRNNTWLGQDWGQP